MSKGSRRRPMNISYAEWCKRWEAACKPEKQDERKNKDTGKVPGARINKI